MPAIADLVPQQGPMCLLDEVLHYDGRNIACRATSHRASANPLRAKGRLPALAGVEYAAQALAAHCSLVEPAPARVSDGVLAGVRALALHVDRLDGIEDPLEVHAERLIVEGSRLLYRFAIEAAGRDLLSGRLAVVLRAKEAK